VTRRFFAALAAAALLAGTAQAQPRPIEGADPAIWQGEARSGPIVHRASNVALPEELEGYRRARVIAVAADDAAANYEWREGRTRVRATVYLFRPGELPEHSLRGSLNALSIASPSAFVWAQGPFDVESPRALHGYKGTFKTGIGPNTVMDYLYFFRLGTWTVKVRATMTGVEEIEQEERLDAFVRALPWDQILAANGDCNGAACSAPAFEAIDNHMMQSTLGPMLFMRTSFDTEAEAALPVATRAEIAPMGTLEVRSSEGEQVSYVATLPELATYRLVRIPDEANDMITETFGRFSVTKPVYGLLIQSGEHPLMPRLFHGEPTPEAFAEAVRGLVLNELPGPIVPLSQVVREMPE
jgi:hypothetical protein